MDNLNSIEHLLNLEINLIDDFLKGLYRDKTVPIYIQEKLCKLYADREKLYEPYLNKEGDGYDL